MVSRLIGSFLVFSLLSGCLSQPPAPVVNRQGGKTATPSTLPKSSSTPQSGSRTGTGTGTGSGSGPSDRGGVPRNEGSGEPLGEPIGEPVQQGIPLPDMSAAPAPTNTIATPGSESGPTAALLAQSRAARKNGDDGRAVELIERAIRMSPTDADLWLELAEVHLANGRDKEANNCARKALQFGGQNTLVTQRANEIIRRAGGIHAG